MTEQQFQYNVNKNTIEYDGKFVAYVNCVDVVMNEFDEVEYITDIVDCEGRDFADFFTKIR